MSVLVREGKTACVSLSVPLRNHRHPSLNPHFCTRTPQPPVLVFRGLRQNQKGSLEPGGFESLRPGGRICIAQCEGGWTHRYSLAMRDVILSGSG